MKKEKPSTRYLMLGRLYSSIDKTNASLALSSSLPYVYFSSSFIKTCTLFQFSRSVPPRSSHLFHFFGCSCSSLFDRAGASPANMTKQCCQYSFSSPPGRKWGAWPKSGMVPAAFPGSGEADLRGMARVVAGQSTDRGRIGYAIKGWVEGKIALEYPLWFTASGPMGLRSRSCAHASVL